MKLNNKAIVDKLTANDNTAMHALWILYKALEPQYNEETRRTTLSRKQIAVMTSLSINTVVKATRYLEELDIIKTEAHIGEDGANLTNAYLINPDLKY